MLTCRKIAPRSVPFRNVSLSLTQTKAEHVIPRTLMLPGADHGARQLDSPVHHRRSRPDSPGSAHKSRRTQVPRFPLCSALKDGRPLLRSAQQPLQVHSSQIEFGLSCLGSPVCRPSYRRFATTAKTNANANALITRCMNSPHSHVRSSLTPVGLFAALGQSASSFPPILIKSSTIKVVGVRSHLSPATCDVSIRLPADRQ